MSEPVTPGPQPSGHFEGYEPRRVPDAPARPVSSARPRPHKRKITVGLATLLAIGAFALGAVVGWVGRGGPAKPALVTNNQDVPVVTLTQDAPATP